MASEASQQQQAPSQIPNPGMAMSLPKEPEKPIDERISPKLSILMRREKVAIERERAAKAKEAEVQNKYKDFTEREKRLQEFEAIKSTNPRRALELLGMSYQDLTQAELNDGMVTPDYKIKQVESKFDSYIKNQEEALLRDREEKQRLEEKRNADTIDQFKGQINSYIKENSGRYELIEFEQEHDLIYDLIDEHYNRTLKEARDKAEAEGRDPSMEVGQVMKTAEAADKVELLLEQKYQKASTVTKIQGLMAPRPAPTSAKLDKPNFPEVGPQRQAQKTINNSMAPTQSTRSTGILSDEERVAKAIAYAKGLRPGR